MKHLDFIPCHQIPAPLPRRTSGGLLMTLQHQVLFGTLLVCLIAIDSGQVAGRDDPPAVKETPRRFELDDLGKLVGVSDPQVSPDGKSVVVVVSRPNYEKNRSDKELVMVDVASGKQRVLTFDRAGVGQPRWSPNGDRLAF